MLSNITIESFRGLKDVSICSLGKINFIFGDNNSGKSSLLEAIHFLSMGFNVRGIISLARIRENNKSPLVVRTVSEYVPDLFSFGNIENPICVFASSGNKSYLEKAGGRFREGYTTNRRSFSSSLRISEILSLTIGTQDGLRDFVITDGELPRKSDRVNFPSQYVTTYGHLSSNILRPFINDLQLMEEGVNLARSFDSRIAELLFQKSKADRAVDSVRLNDGSLLPLSSFGEGLRKCLYILGGTANARGGTLLIDEFDDAIAPESYLIFLEMLAREAIRKDIQVFATTHRIDVIKALRNVKDWPLNLDEICALTTKKIDGETHIRSLPIKTVMERMDAFDFEVRE